MGCPVHIWGPLMASMVPFARVARDRVSALRARRHARGGGDLEPMSPPELRRWAAIQPRTAPPADTARD
jgi:hypothetical protein